MIEALERIDVEPVAAAVSHGRPRWAPMARIALFVGGMAAAASIVALSVVRGRALERAVPLVRLGAAPLVGRDLRDGWDWRFGWGLVAAGVIAVAVVAAVLRSWFWRARLRTVVVVTAMTSMAFSVALALTDGNDGILHGATDRTEYLANLATAPPAGTFVRTFVASIDDYSVHVRGHPPGYVLVLKALASVGLGGQWSTALLSVLGTAVTVVAVLVTVWAVAGADWVRRTAPFLVVAPYAIWMVTSADSVYTAIGATAVAIVALGLRTSGARSATAGLGGGLLLGSLMFLTYLGVIFALTLVPLLVRDLLRRRASTVRTVAGVVLGIGVIVLGFRLAGFWWIDGARRTRTEYWEGTASLRPWGYFRYGNLAVAIIAIGPAGVAGLLRLRDRRMWLLVGGTVIALVASHLSQYTRAEVERIWLLFYPWLTISAGAIAALSARRAAATWVGAQAVCAIVLQAALVSKW